MKVKGEPFLIEAWTAKTIKIIHQNKHKRLLVEHLKTMATLSAKRIA